MNILILDQQSILSEKQKLYVKNRLYYSLLRFEHKINGVTMHVSVDCACERVTCAINVSIEGSGIVSINRSGVSSDSTMKRAIEGIEPKVARRVDWRAWLNADSIATAMISFSQPLKWLFGFDNKRNRTSNHLPFAVRELEDVNYRRTTIPNPHFQLITRTKDSSSKRLIR